ncbi:FAD binding domain-containing protein [Zhengella sp. ZM62]|uniref:FAD binding domain-containing protein n=1 Tax=Zhengella sedimenti TaxID=3390035 RepID=UPI0039765FD7
MTYVRPETLGEALDRLAAKDARIAAGCTDLFTLTQDQALPWPVVDVTAIAELKTIRRTGDGWRIGAAASWRAIAAADLPPAFDALKLAAREVGSAQIQTAATIGGNLCNASPAADGVPPLLILDAEVEITCASGTRCLPLADFITGPRQTALRPGEMVTAILVPGHGAGGNGHFIKLGARKHLLISVAMVAARLEIDGGTIRRAALAVGACGPVATRLPALEAMLEGLPAAHAPATVTNELVFPALAPIDDIRADRAYRLEAATELLRRAIAELADGARP